MEVKDIAFMVMGQMVRLYIVGNIEIEKRNMASYLAKVRHLMKLYRNHRIPERLTKD